MKTIFTTITMLVLLCLGIAAHGELKKSETGKKYFLNARNGLLQIPKKQISLNNF
jgi:hypothetical protein